MVAVMQELAYVLILSSLALLAVERAHRSGHDLRDDALFGFGGAGAVATLVASAENVLSPLLIVTFACVAICAATDLSSGYIYNSVILGAAFGAAANAFVGDATSSISGSCLGCGLAITVRVLSGGRGLGLGDVKLFAVVGAGIGVLAVVYCFGAAFVLGAIVSLALVAATHIKRTASIRFAPYIAVATMVTPCLRLGVL